MTGSLNTVWVPALATAHAIGFVLFVYALEQTTGAVTYWTWMLKYHLFLKKKFKGNFGLAWYYTYPGAKEAHDAKQADASGPVKADGKDPEGGVDPPDGRSYPMPAELFWKDVSYRVKAGRPPKPKTVLHRSNGSFKPCEAVALMGPSGAGKSTLLDILAGRKMGPGVGGSVEINGAPLTTQTANQFTSYIGQEDVFVATISVWEALLFYTRLSLPSEVSDAERTSRMEAVLTTMGLLRVKNSKVGGLLPGGVTVRGISGGEKRRLSIACGLVANPSILFLDEPTTGLDSHAALAVMDHLVGLTDHGLTIVASIHQPRQEIFESFDKVLVLSEGYQLFFAPPAYSQHWFNNVLGMPYDIERDGTVADWLIGLVSISFYKDKETADRTLASVEEVRQAAAQFATLQKEAEREAEDKHQDLLDTAASIVDKPAPAPGSLGQDESYKYMMASWALSSVGATDLLSTKEKRAVEGLNDTQEPPIGMDTLDALPDEHDLFSQRQYPRSWFVQYSVLFKRQFVGTLRNPAECAVRLLMCVWVSMCAGLVYIRLVDNATSSSPRLATLFFSTMLFLMNPFSYMSFFLSDRRFFVLDSANGLYSPSAYHFAAVTASAPFVIVNTCAGTLTFYGLCALRYRWQSILIAMSIMSLHALTAQQFAIWAVWFTKTQDAAFSLASSYVAISLLLCGFYVRYADMRLSFVKGISWASFSKYTLQGLARNEFANRDWDPSSCDYNKFPLPLGGGAVPECFTPGNSILEYYDFGLTITQSSLSLLGFYGLFNILAYLALLRMYRRRK